MGLKSGIAKDAERENLYLCLKEEEFPYSFAKVYSFREDKKNQTVLYFLDGAVGILVLNNNHQLVVSKIDQRDWVPTKEEVEILNGEKEIPKSQQMFGGDHVISGVFFKKEKEEEDPFLPMEEHTSLADRFQNPKSFWDRVVGNLLQQGGAF